MAKPIKVEIVGDARGLNTALDEASTGIGGFSAKAAAAVATAGVAFAGLAVAAGKALYDIGGQFDDAYDKLRVGTGATGAQLEALKDEFKDLAKTVPASFDDIGTALTGVTKKLGVTGQDAKDLSTEFLNLSRITDTDLNTNIESGTKALKNWGVAAVDQGAALDKLYRGAQASGLSFADLSDSLAKYGPALRGLGYDMTQAEALIGSLAKGGVDADAALAGLTKGFAKLAKAGKDPVREFNTLVDKIIDAKTESEAAGLAVSLFGTKAGPQLASAIRSGSMNIEAMTTAIASGGDTINQAAADTADFAEKWQLFSNRLKVDIEPLATKVFDLVGQAMDRLGPIVDSLEVKWSSWQPTLQGIADTWLPRLQAGLQVVAEWVGKATGFIQQHQTIMDGLKYTLIGVVAAFGAIVAVVTGGIAVSIAVIGGFAVAVGTVVGTLVNLIEKLGKVKDLWNELTSAVSHGAGGLVGAVTGLLPGHAAGGQVMGGGWATVGERGRENVWLPQGAYVQPSWSGSGGGGDTYNINGSNLSAADVAREIAWQRRRGNGR